MLHPRRIVSSLLAAGALALCLGSGAHAQVGGPYGLDGYGHYGYSHMPRYVHPRHRIGRGYGCYSYRTPHHSYGKYLFHVKYQYPELDYGVRHSPSSFYGYERPVMILPIEPAAPQAPMPQVDETLFEAPALPSSEHLDRFLQLADSSPGVVVIRPVAKAEPLIDLQQRPMTGVGWDLLRQGDAIEAWRALSVDAVNDPFNSLPRLGYALAESMRGKHDQAVWSMRRAIRLDPSAIVSVVPEDDLAGHIVELRRAWANAPGDEDDAADAHFMVATLSCMLGELHEADRALELAIAAGDRSESARNLSAVINSMARRDVTNRVAMAIHQSR